MHFNEQKYQHNIIKGIQLFIDETGLYPDKLVVNDCGYLMLEELFKSAIGLPMFISEKETGKLKRFAGIDIVIDRKMSDYFKLKKQRC